MRHAADNMFRQYTPFLANARRWNTHYFTMMLPRRRTVSHASPTSFNFSSYADAECRWHDSLSRRPDDLSPRTTSRYVS